MKQPTHCQPSCIPCDKDAGLLAALSAAVFVSLAALQSLAYERPWRPNPLQDGRCHDSESSEDPKIQE